MVRSEEKCIDGVWHRVGAEEFTPFPAMHIEDHFIFQMGFREIQ